MFGVFIHTKKNTNKGGGRKFLEVMDMFIAQMWFHGYILSYKLIKSSTQICTAFHKSTTLQLKQFKKKIKPWFSVTR